jgi:hypothetical protein
VGVGDLESIRGEAGVGPGAEIVDRAAAWIRRPHSRLGAAGSVDGEFLRPQAEARAPATKIAQARAIAAKAAIAERRVTCRDLVEFPIGRTLVGLIEK